MVYSSGSMEIQVVPNLVGEMPRHRLDLRGVSLRK